MSDYLNKDSILSADDLPHEDVEVPEWPNPETGNPGIVRMIGLNGIDAQKYSARLVQIDPISGKVIKLKLETVMTDLLLKTMVDEKNQPLFSEADLEALGKKNGAVLTRLFEVAQRLSGLGQIAEKTAKSNLS